MQQARWWLDRLRAMSLGEVVHRSVRLARYPLHRAEARIGRYGRPSPDLLARWRGPATFVFSPLTACAPISRELRAVAEHLLVGRQTVLGLGELALPDEPWHYEPHARGYWPQVDAARVVAAAPDGFDPRTTWELNRGHGWVVLARAYAATRDARFRGRLVDELQSWLRRNPIGVGINWVSAMEAAIRCHAFAWIAALLRGELDDALWRLLAELLHQHAAFVARNLSRFSSANNHLIVELSGLVVAGRALGVDAWRDKVRELADEAERQTHGDGVNVEMATHYHAFVLEALLLVAWLERAHGAPARRLEQVIAKMAAYLDAITLRSGVVLEQGDHDDGKIIPLLDAPQLLAAAAALAPGAREAQGEGARLLCDGPPGVRAAAARSQRFADAGQVVLRSPRLHATFDAGPFGFGALAAHAHCDALAVNLAFDDRPLLVERGTYRYNGDRALRDRYRATAAHNTVQVGDREQGDAAGAFLWTRKPLATIEHCALERDRDLARASHDGFAPARHVRSVHRLGDTLAVVDEVRGASAPVIARWHLAPEAAILELHPGWVILDDGSATPRWLWLGCDGQPLRATATVTLHSARYLAQESASSLEVALPAGGKRLMLIAGPDAYDREAALRAALGSIA